MLEKDYYRMLGLPRKASEDEVKRAYRRLALKYHPDHHPDDSECGEKFKEIGEAYAVLSDLEKRREYDRFGDSGFKRRYTREDIFHELSFERLYREYGVGKHLGVLLGPAAILGVLVVSLFVSHLVSGPILALEQGV